MSIDNLTDVEIRLVDELISRKDLDDFKRSRVITSEELLELAVVGGSTDRSSSLNELKRRKRDSISASHWRKAQTIALWVLNVVVFFATLQQCKINTQNTQLMRDHRAVVATDAPRRLLCEGDVIRALETTSLVHDLCSTFSR